MLEERLKDSCLTISFEIFLSQAYALDLITQIPKANVFLPRAPIDVVSNFRLGC